VPRRGCISFNSSERTVNPKEARAGQRVLHLGLNTCGVVVGCLVVDGRQVSLLASGRYGRRPMAPTLSLKAATTGSHYSCVYSTAVTFQVLVPRHVRKKHG
jgi:hypothetical protein